MFPLSRIISYTLTRIRNPENSTCVAVKVFMRIQKYNTHKYILYI